jgi:hypothetical protein
MQTSLKTLVTLAAFGLATAAVAQPTPSGNTSGSGAKSPDTTRPDGAKGSGTMGATDSKAPSPSGAASMSKEEKAQAKADKKAAKKAKKDAKRAEKADSGTQMKGADSPPAGASSSAKP